MGAALWGWCAVAGSVPPPPELSAANCATPTYASDQLVCADPELLALDRRMVELLAPASLAASAPALHWFEPQQDWFRRRSLCAFSARHVACLRAAYRERIELLSALAGQASGHERPSFLVRCFGAPWGHGLVHVHPNDGGTLLIKDGRARVLVMASDLQTRDDWSPFLRIVRENKVIRLVAREGTVVRCRVLHNQRPAEMESQGNRPQ